MTKSESQLKESRAEDLNSSHYLINFEWIFTKLGDLYSGLHRNVLQVWDLMKLYKDIDKIGDNITKSGSCGKAELRAELDFNRLS